MFAVIDKVSDACGRVAAWLFCVIGLLITAEVVSRYIFNAPTPWTEDISQALQIWATYLAAAFVLRHRDLIVIEFFLTRMGPKRRRFADTVSLLAILVFAAFAVVYGWAIVAESVAQNRHASTMLGMPRWITEAAIPVGFTLLALQAVAEVVRLWCPGSGEAVQ